MRPALPTGAVVARPRDRWGEWDGVMPYLRALARLWKHSELGRIPVRTNARLTASAGRWNAPAGVIEIAARLSCHDGRLRREVLCHEAAHAVVWARHGRNAKPHGLEWQALVRQAGFEPRASLIRCGHRTPPKPAQRFRHACAVCHFSRTATRQMARWRCPECRAVGLQGHLRIERVASGR
jgi:predicted SprT family Zn-dependent metalloprotease